jgi:hypothetical protein
MTAPRSTVLPLEDRYDVAYLAGGHQRLADTAVAALLDSGRIGVRPTGELYVVDLHRRHPVEAAVLDALGTRGRSLVTLRWRLREDDRIRAVPDRLARDGLLTRPGRPGLLHRRRGDGTPTPEGRRVLRRLRIARTAEHDVALWGPGRLADPQLRETAFTPARVPHTGRPFRGHVVDELGAFPGPWWVPVAGKPVRGRPGG